MLFTIRTAEDRERVNQIEYNTLKVWNAKFESTMDMLVEHNKFYREYQRGHGASKHESGEGIVEARIPLHLMLLMMRGDPDLLTNDKKFYAFLNRHKEFRSYNYKG